jgi:hypothetical protein
MKVENLTLSTIPREMDDVIILCLVDYWTRQGLTLEKAMAAACKALERLRRNTDDRTWCLLPNQEQLP